MWRDCVHSVVTGDRSLIALITSFKFSGVQYLQTFPSIFGLTVGEPTIAAMPTQCDAIK